MRKLDGSRILILGATSAIASEVARLLAPAKCSFYLADLAESRVSAVADDLRVRGASTVVHRALDLCDCGVYAEVLDDAWRELGRIDLALIAFGILGDQEKARNDVSKALEILNVNFTCPVAWITELSRRFEAQNSGCIAAISSVAGDRGRQSNYYYGAAKGGLTVFLEGLRHRLAGSNVRVLTIKPGMVDTPMTAHLPKGPLFAQPATVASAIVTALEKGRAEVYVPAYWRAVMFVIRHLPRRIFDRMKI